MVSEVLDEKGNVANVTRTETEATLVAADERGYALRVESTIEVAGRRFASQPQVVKHGYYGEAPGETVTLKKLGAAELAIGGRAVLCEVRQVVFHGAEGERISTIHYSSEIPPYQLRRETVLAGQTEDQRQTTLVETVALDLPQKVLGQLQPAAFLKTTRKSPLGTKVTVEVHSDEVPGGVVSHSANETDASGRIVRRSTLELIDYAVGGHPPEADPVTRRRRFSRNRQRGMD